MSKEKRNGFKIDNTDESLRGLAEEIIDCFDKSTSLESPSVWVRVCWGEELKISVSKMYEYVPMTFKIMLKISKVLGTEEFEINQWSSDGCETCDYGSQYTQEISVDVKKLKKGLIKTVKGDSKSMGLNN